MTENKENNIYCAARSNFIVTRPHTHTRARAHTHTNTHTSKGMLHQAKAQ